MHVAGASANFTQPTLSAGGNWVQDVSNASASDGADWMDPNSSKGSDAVSLAANAFATAHQIMTTNKNTIAVNTGITVLSKQLTGQSVNILA